MRAELANLPSAWPGDPSWFWHGEQILSLVEQHRPAVCVELGTWKGGSAIPIARLVRQWGGIVYCIDGWERHLGPSWYRDIGGTTLIECAQNMAAAGVSDSVRLIQADTVEEGHRWDTPIDFLYVDADHTYEGCAADLSAWWPHLKVGGLIAGDDYADPRQIGVTRAWDEFEVAQAQGFNRCATPTTPHTCQLIWGVKQ